MQRSKLVRENIALILHILKAMDFLLPNRKSIAASAQRVVADMHRDLEEHKTRVAELEDIVERLQVVATESLQNELFRLEMRRKELLLDLERTDSAILDRRARLATAKSDVEYVRAHPHPDIHAPRSRINSNASNNGPNMSTNTSGNLMDAVKEEQKNMNSMVDINIGRNLSNDSHDPSHRPRLSSAEIRGQSLEDEYLEENEMLTVIRKTTSALSAGKNFPTGSVHMLFVVHCNNIDDVIVYYPITDSMNSNNSGNECVACSKLIQNGGDEQPSLLDLTSYESLVSYGAKLVPNHERDFPHVKDLSPPSSLMGTQAGILGQLVGAIQLPLTPDVIIDIWILPNGVTWATTSIDGNSFSHLERIFVTSEMNHGVSQVVAVDIFGRHDRKGYMLLEKVTA